MEGVRQMLGRQMGRHQAAWDAFVGVRDGTQQQLEEDVGSVAAGGWVRALHLLSVVLPDGWLAGGRAGWWSRGREREVHEGGCWAVVELAILS